MVLARTRQYNNHLWTSSYNTVKWNKAGLRNDGGAQLDTPTRLLLSNKPFYCLKLPFPSLPRFSGRVVLLRLWVYLNKRDKEVQRDDGDIITLIEPIRKGRACWICLMIGHYDSNWPPRPQTLQTLWSRFYLYLYLYLYILYRTLISRWAKSVATSEPNQSQKMAL